ncbi:hypothetical protein ACNKHK_03145 [Shigella flexneri]
MSNKSSINKKKTDQPQKKKKKKTKKKKNKKKKKKKKKKTFKKSLSNANFTNNKARCNHFKNIPFHLMVPAGIDEEMSSFKINDDLRSWHIHVDAFSDEMCSDVNSHRLIFSYAFAAGEKTAGDQMIRYLLLLVEDGWRVMFC